jgi:hypothetical protein
MRYHGESSPSAPHLPPPPDADGRTLKRLLPYLFQYKWRVAAALLFMVGAKLANVSVPILLKHLVDAMSFKPSDPVQVLVVPAALLLGYGLLRLMTSAFTELRELVFAKATQGAARSIALETFEHLHALSLRFHLARQTGGMTRDIERGVRGIESLISYSLYSIVPTLIEVKIDPPNRRILPLIIEYMNQSAAPATLMSFDEPSVWRMATLMPERQIGQLIEPLDDLGPHGVAQKAARARNLNCAYLAPHHSSLATLRDAGPLVTWTIRTENELAIARKHGAAAIFEGLKPALAIPGRTPI